MPVINVKLTGMDIIALWGAIVATLVLIWDIYKWKTSGPHVRFKVSPNKIVIGDVTREGNKYISAEAINIGARPTTITNLVFQYYENYIKMLFHKPSISMIVNNPSTSQRLPYMLKPGDVWLGLALQTSEIETYAKKGYLVCGLCHSHSDKEIDRRIIIKNQRD